MPPSKHARLSPSGSPTWLECPASVFLDDRLRLKNDGELPDDTTRASDNGTKAHAYAEAAIRLRYTTMDNVSEERVKRLRDEIPSDVLENAEIYVEKVLELIRRYREDEIGWNVETRFPLWYEPESKGTADFWMVEKMTKTLRVLDYKSGFTPVEAERNTQGIIYTIAAYDRLQGFFDLEHFEVGICQPAIRHEPTWWEFGLEELEHFRIQINRAVREINEPLLSPRFNPGEKQCQWCRHRRNATCPELARQIFAGLGENEAEKEVDDNTLIEVYTKGALLKSYLDSVEERVREMPAETLRRGGLKRVKGNRQFVWDQPEEEIITVLSGLGIDPMTEKLKSPAQARKELGGDEPLEGLYATKFNKPLLVPTNDRRPALEDEE